MNVRGDRGPVARLLTLAWTGSRCVSFRVTTKNDLIESAPCSEVREEKRSSLWDWEDWYP